MATNIEETLAESTAKRLLAALKNSLKDCKAEDVVNIEIDFKVKTISGNEKTGRVIASNMGEYHYHYYEIYRVATRYLSNAFRKVDQNEP